MRDGGGLVRHSSGCEGRRRKSAWREIQKACMADATNKSNELVLPCFLSGATPSTPYVKICGVTNPDDAFAAIECGADALGFNVFPGSKRFLDLDSARKWIPKLPAHIARVVVGVNPVVSEAEAWLEGDLFHALQLHGEGWHPFVNRFVGIGKPLIAAVQVRADAGDSFRLEWFDGFAVMFDGYRRGDYGGTGETFRWELLNRLNINKPIILAGGLRSDNVRAAIKLTRPYAVDVATGVESEPRKKDYAKLRDFIAAVRDGTGS
jgi:phosphoribosylanthranilate isomerase